MQSPELLVKRSFFATIVAQGRHPLTPMRVANDGSHAAKLAFRLVPPLLVHVTHLSVEGYYVVQGLLGVATLALLAWCFHHTGYSRAWSLAIVIGIASTYMGAVWFLDTQPYFDAIAASALLVALCARPPAAVFLVASVALWTDERALLALGVVALFHFGRRRANTWTVAAAVAAYLVVRLALGVRYGLTTGKSEIGPGVLIDYWRAMPLAITLALEGLWVIVGAGYWRALQARRWPIVAAGLLTLLSALVSVMVNDVTRSTVYMLPGVVVAVTQLVDLSPEQRRRLLGVPLAVCVLCPTAGFIVTTNAVLDHVGSFPPLPLRLIF